MNSVSFSCKKFFQKGKNIGELHLPQKPARTACLVSEQYSLEVNGRQKNTLTIWKMQPTTQALRVLQLCGFGLSKSLRSSARSRVRSSAEIPYEMWSEFSGTPVTGVCWGHFPFFSGGQLSAFRHALRNEHAQRAPWHQYQACTELARSLACFSFLIKPSENELCQLLTH